MNTNAYQERQGAPRPASYFTDRPAKQGATRTKISFDPPRVPVILKPEAVPAHPVPGKFGEQYQWFFEGDQVAWFDPDVHEELCACLRIAECSEVAITKHVRKGQAPRFEVQPVRDETQQHTTRAQLVNRRVEEIQAAPQQPAAPARQARPSRVWPTIEASEAETAGPCNAMAKALAGAIVACQEVIGLAQANGIDFKPTTEDIRAIAITIFIQEQKR